METLEDRRLLAAVTVTSQFDFTNGDVSSIGNLIANNGGDGISLREAIIASNATFGADVIMFATPMSGATINLGGTELEITEALTIDAAPLAQNVTINAQQQSRIFNITATSGNFTLAGLTLTGGKTTGNSGDDFDSTYSGGAVRSASIAMGMLTLNECTVTGNSTVGTFSNGGGIHAYSLTLTQTIVSDNHTTGTRASGGGVSASELTLTRSTISGNSTNFYAGGIYARNNASIMQSAISGNSAKTSAGGMYANVLTLTQSTVSGNSTSGPSANGGGILTAWATLLQSTVSDNSTTGASASGGGIYVYGNITLRESTISGNSVSGTTAHGGGIFSDFGVTLTQSTITGNRAIGANSQGGGIFQNHYGPSYVSLLITNSIITGNTAIAGHADVRFDTDGMLIANDSLIGTGITPTSGVNNVVTNNPRLGPLANNGGPTQTHALLPGSPAIDAGPGPVAYYRFEETSGTAAADVVGVHPGVLQNGVALNQPGPSQIGGNAASFDGVNDYVSVASPFSAAQLSGNSYSVELWFNANNSTTEQTLVALTDATGGHAVLVELNPGGVLRFLNRVPAGNSGGDSLASPAATFAAGQWNHLAAVRDGEWMRIYLNGAQVAFLIPASGNLPANLRLTMGRLSHVDPAHPFGGKLDEVVIHNRALTPSEIALRIEAGSVDQRGAGFPRVVDGDGNGTSRIDIGAYEALVKPSADFDANGQVDGNDFLRWQRGLGAVNATLAQGNSDGDADADISDLAAWRVHLGATGVTSEAAATANARGASESALSAAVAAASESEVTPASEAPRDAFYAAGDFTGLFGDRASFRPIGKARMRRG
jgi:hypothetical protein